MAMSRRRSSLSPKQTAVETAVEPGYASPTPPMATAHPGTLPPPGGVGYTTLTTPGFAPGEPIPGSFRVPASGSTPPGMGDNGGPTPGGTPPVGFDDWLRSTLQGTPYGPAGLAGLESQITERGGSIQKHSDGRVRGRVFTPDGRAIDLPGAGEGNDWWNSPMAQGWGWTDRGVQGPSGPTTPQGGPMASSLGAIGPYLQANGQTGPRGADFYNNIMQMLLGQLGLSGGR